MPAEWGGWTIWPVLCWAGQRPGYEPSHDFRLAAAVAKTYRQNYVWSRVQLLDQYRTRTYAAILIVCLLAAFAFLSGSSSARPTGLPNTPAAVQAQAAILTSNTTPARWRAIRLAETQRGKAYCWGGTGTSCYDCSGLVYWAYGKVGFHFGRSTGDMLSSGKLVRTYHPHWGDLVFWSGHVEFYSSASYSFGAQRSGTRIGFHAYWGSYRFYHVTGSG